MDPTSAPAPMAAPAKREPPPEKPEAVSLRTKIVISFWAVIVLLGVPTWWQTTSIYRANLPLQEMVDWADGLVSIAKHSVSALLTVSCRTLLLPFPCMYGSKPLIFLVPTRNDLCKIPSKHLMTLTSILPYTSGSILLVDCGMMEVLNGGNSIRAAAKIPQAHL